MSCPAPALFLLMQTTVEVRYVRDRSEQLRILRASHIDPTAGHMGIKRTLYRINERFMWHGLIKDVEEMVCYLAAITVIYVYCINTPRYLDVTYVNESIER